MQILQSVGVMACFTLCLIEDILTAQMHRVRYWSK